LLSDAFFVDLQHEHTRYSEAVTVRVKYLFAFNQFSGDSIDRFVGMIFRKRAAAPLKEPDQFGASLEIMLAGAFAIPSQRGEQSVKGLLR
jgi:hypothetical protein